MKAVHARLIIDKAFTLTGMTAIAFMAAALVFILFPIFSKGAGAVVFRATVEHRRMLLERFGRGDQAGVTAEVEASRKDRQPLYDMLERFRTGDLARESGQRAVELKRSFKELNKLLSELLGPAPGGPLPVLPRMQYGKCRLDQAREALDDVLNLKTWDYSGKDRIGRLVSSPRRELFAGTSLEALFPWLEENFERIMRPRTAFYFGFFLDSSLDSHLFGGIWPEILGTIYLTIGAMILAVPLGIIAGIYFAEYARDGRLVWFLRVCVSTLAGVPSIVFGLFGLAFFINAMHVSNSKSVLAGSLTLGMLVLPTIIRASEEAIRAVPRTYKEAAMSLGAGRWRTVTTVIIPAALPGILTGVVISMARAAGETAPIIFTAAVSVGMVLGNPLDALNQPTPALSWNIYNICTEHEALDRIRHVQYGMVAALILIVLALNLAAIRLRARISKKLRG